MGYGNNYKIDYFNYYPKIDASKSFALYITYKDATKMELAFEIYFTEI